MIGAAFLSFCLAAAAAPAPAREVRVIMGTTAELQAGGLEDPKPALDAGFAAFGLVDDTMSLWKPSELGRLNDSGGARVSEDLYRVLEAAVSVARASGGAFDPTVEPLVRAAGGMGGERRRLSSAERRALLARVGHERIRLDPEGRRVTLDGARVDLGGIAKGYAVDLALAALRKAGATQGLADLGGSSVGVFGLPLDMAARDPETEDGAPWARFLLSEGALSTSGGDQKPDHILDPRTGLPAREGVLSATVVARSAVEADALSTAVYVLGVPRGLALLVERGAAGFVLRRDRGRRTVWATEGFADAYRLELAPGVRLREGE